MAKKTRDNAAERRAQADRIIERERRRRERRKAGRSQDRRAEAGVRSADKRLGPKKK